MITEKDLQEAIAECQGQPNPSSSTCIKLAAFLTIQEHMYGKKDQDNTSFEPVRYSDSNGPNVIEYDSDTEFGSLINGRKTEDILPLIDELMDTIHVLNPRLYASVIRKIQQ